MVEAEKQSHKEQTKGRETMELQVVGEKISGIVGTLFALPW
jgi:hypothetical protein